MLSTRSHGATRTRRSALEPEARPAPRPATLEGFGLVQAKPGVWTHPDVADLDFGPDPGAPPQAGAALVDLEPGEPPDRLPMLAARLWDFLTRHTGSAPLEQITKAAGAAGLIGDRLANGSWSRAADLLRARKLVPSVPAASGWTVAEVDQPESPGEPPVRHWVLAPID